MRRNKCIYGRGTICFARFIETPHSRYRRVVGIVFVARADRAADVFIVFIVVVVGSTSGPAFTQAAN